MFGRLLPGTYIFGGFCLLAEFCHVQTSLCGKVLRCPILVALLHDTRPACVSQTLRRGTKNGITELSQTAPPRPIFGWAAITFGIGPHSSFFFLLLSSAFFLAYSQPSQIGCLLYLHTWCGLNANSECMSEMWCTWFAGNIGRKNRQKFATGAPSPNFVGLYFRN